MTEKYAELRKAVQHRNIFCHPDGIAEYRSAANSQAMAALFSKRDALGGALQGVIKVADRDTSEFEAARAALAQGESI